MSPLPPTVAGCPRAAPCSGAKQSWMCIPAGTKEFWPCVTGNAGLHWRQTFSCDSKLCHWYVICACQTVVRPPLHSVCLKRYGLSQRISHLSSGLQICWPAAIVRRMPWLSIAQPSRGVHGWCWPVERRAQPEGRTGTQNINTTLGATWHPVPRVHRGRAPCGGRGCGRRAPLGRRRRRRLLRVT